MGAGILDIEIEMEAERRWLSRLNSLYSIKCAGTSLTVFDFGEINWLFRSEND